MQGEVIQIKACKVLSAVQGKARHVRSKGKASHNKSRQDKVMQGKIKVMQGDSRQDITSQGNLVKARQCNAMSCKARYPKAM